MSALAPLSLGTRLERASRALAYIAASVPLAALSAAVALLLLLGASLSVVGVGLPLLLAAAVVGHRLALADRRLANRLLRAQIPPLPERPRREGSPWRRSLDVLSERRLWRTFAALVVKPPLIAGMLVVGLAPVVLLAELLILGVQGVGGLGGVDYVGPWALGVPAGIGLLLLALPSAVLCVAVLEGLQTVLCTLTRGLLAPRTAAPGEPVREMLAESLGDRSLSIAYWLPERETFVDEAGRLVELPEPGSGRTWTAVERDGRRVAAIVHDAALDTTPELVHAAAAGSSMALDNERLKADLRARVEELRVSRRRLVEASYEARRRIERDLHDGAQQHLVGLALELRLLRGKLGDEALAAEVDALAERLGTALAELRELARGIHPAVLTRSGLEPAIRAAADRAPLPVECDVLDERLPEGVEAAAYFVVAEGLTNVARYARATRAWVRVQRHGDGIEVEVGDDGGGGAAAGGGSGLRGLGDRVGALDGELLVVSPAGGGTRLIARIPCEPAAVDAVVGAAEQAGAAR